jgi:hypothetical protein
MGATYCNQRAIRLSVAYFGSFLSMHYPGERMFAQQL